MKIKMNEGFKRLKGNYVFADIRKKIAEKEGENLIDLSVGDAAYPIAKVVGEAMKKAADEMSSENFKGYPPASGYPFLKTAIKNYYIHRGVEVREDEVFKRRGEKRYKKDCRTFRGFDGYNLCAGIPAAVRLRRA